MPSPSLGTLLLAALAAPSPQQGLEPQLELRAGDSICLLGNALAERMQHDGWFEARVQTRFPELGLTFRNLGFGGDELTVHQRTMNFGKFSADGMEGDLPEERYLVWDRYLEHCRADVVLAFLGFNESFAGPGGVTGFRNDLIDFVRHVRGKTYGSGAGRGAPRLVLVGPLPYENLERPGVDAQKENLRLNLYDAAMRHVAGVEGVPFVSLLRPMIQRYAQEEAPLTINGVHLNPRGNEVLAEVLDEALFGPRAASGDVGALRALVQEKNELWFQRYRATDGYNVYGGRSRQVYAGAESGRPYSNFDVLQRELDYLDTRVEALDGRIQALLSGRPAPAVTLPELIAVESNKRGNLPDGHFSFLSGVEAIDHMTAAPGMRVELFADEKQFPELANPVQMAFDTRGRLWVAVWPTYPHWRPDLPCNDKLLILEDTDGDGRADRSTTFAGDLHNPTGFEFWNGGVLLAQVPDLVFLKDTDGDDRYDTRERLLHGLSSADTHHSANSFVLGPDGALYFQEGTFHRSQIETPFGPVRDRNACFWRFEPRSGRVERYVPYDFANPHGHVFDRWGQDFLTDGTGNVNYYALPFTGALPAGERHRGYFPFFQQRSRPVGGSEILSSRHFPAENQQSYLLANVIGFLGVFQYRLEDDGSGFGATELTPIVESNDPNFRPVDLEVGPDGALYLLDWHNPLIGHLQHHLRDPNRDATHGRVYRVTCEGRPLLPFQPLAGAPIETLLEHLRSPEDRQRYRARIELSARDSDAVERAVQAWTLTLAEDDPELEHHLLEALWLLQQHERMDLELLTRVLASPDPRARAAATRVLRYGRQRVPDALERLARLVEDENPRVRLEAVVAASFFDSAQAAAVALAALKHPTDRFLDYALEETLRGLAPRWKAALKAGTFEGADEPGAVAYLLERVTGDELLALPHTGAVLEAAATRHGVDAGLRRRALEELAQQRGSRLGAEILRAIGLVDARGDGHAAHVLDELGTLLLAERESLTLAEVTALTEPTHLAPTRALGFAAWIARPGGADEAWNAARRSTAGLLAFLEAVRLVPEAQTRAALFGRLRPLAFAPPTELLGDGAGSGLTVSFHEPAPPQATREVFDALAPSATVQAETFTLDLAPARGSDSFGLAFRGTLHVPESGRYRFFTNSDDGTRLYLDGTCVVDNDGPHPMEEKNGTIELAAGAHEIFLGFFEAGGAEGLEVSWEGPSFRKQPIPASALGSGGGRVLRAAALRALAHVPGHAPEKLADAARLVAEPALLEATVELLRSVEAPSAEGTRAVVETLAAALAGLDPTARTSPGPVAALEWARTAIEVLPSEQAARLRGALAGLGGTIVLVRTVPHQMLYDLPEFWVQAGQPVAILFQNNDVMPHNLVVAVPGALASVGEAAERMVGGEARDHIPERAEVLWHTRLLKPGESERLTFVAPDAPGEHPYLCTYPGHWRVMNGVMHVVAELDPGQTVARRASDAGSAPARTFVKDWTVADLEPLFASGAADWRQGRSLERGRELFGAVGCAQCHHLGDLGTTVGPDLAGIREKYHGLELLRQLIEPSHSVLEGWAFEGFETEDGRVIGRVRYEDEHELRVATSLLRPDDLTVVLKADVLERWDTQLSPMPSGLLVTLTADEILDLLSFLEGDSQ